jgi:hypothetical protein
MASKPPRRLQQLPPAADKHELETARLPEAARAFLETSRRANPTPGRTMRSYAVDEPVPSVHDVLDHLTGDAHVLLNIANHVTKRVVDAVGDFVTQRPTSRYATLLAKYRSAKEHQ